jgi:adenylate kinase
MFRAEMKAGTELGKMASSIMSSGGLVGDDIVNAIVASRISKPDCVNGFLLDGYPRTVPQAKMFADLLQQKGLPAPIVVHLDVNDDVLVKRLTARRQCPKCLKIYNLLHQPPRVEGKCDDDGADLTQRADDCEETIRQRLTAYAELTGPILNYYGPAMVQTVDGTLPLEQVSKEIEKAVSALTKARPAVAK